MYQIIRQKRKTVAIYIDENMEVIIKVPNKMSAKELQGLIEKYQPQIQKMLQKKEELRQKSDWRITGEILYLGTYRKVHIAQESYGKSDISFQENQFFIKTQGNNKDEEAKQLIEAFYRKEAGIILTQLTNYYAGMINAEYKKITIRNQKTRWGSCSTKGNISYNVRLLCAPKEMIAYVVLHEVMHLKHFNHSLTFWEEIGKVMPDYRDKVNYFKRFGQNFIL